MNLKYIYISLFLILGSVGTIAQEYRIGIGYDKKFSKHTKFLLDVAFEDDLYSTEYSLFAQPGIKFKFLKYFQFSPAIRYTLEKQVHEFEGEYRLSTDLSFKKKMKNDLIIQNRFRYQSEFEDEKMGKHFYRNKIKFSYKLTNTTKPHIAFEPYYSLKREKIERVKIYFGEEVEIGKHDLGLDFIIDGEVKRGALKTQYQFRISYKL